MSQTPLARIKEFCGAFARHQAQTVRDLPGGGGVVLRHDEYWTSHEHNQLLIDGAPLPLAEDLPELADTALGHLPHRRITVFDETAGTAYAPVLKAAGYQHEPELVMVYDASGPRRTPATNSAPEARPAELAEIRMSVMGQLRRWMPESDETVIRHLTDRRLARTSGAEQVLFLTVRDENGAVGAWADLYLDSGEGTGHGSIAQLEDVATADTHVRRGYGDAMLDAALRRAADHDLFFLLADPYDWPRHWYARRGFTTIGTFHGFTRAEAPRLTFA